MKSREEFVTPAHIERVKTMTRGSKHAIAWFFSPCVSNEVYIFSRPKAGGRGYLQIERSVAPYSENWGDRVVIRSNVHTARMALDLAYDDAFTRSFIKAETAR